MKRLNPLTNKPFSYGDIREDGSLGVSYKHSDPKSMIITAFSLFNDKINSSKTDYRDFGRFINTIFFIINIIYFLF